MTESSLSNQIKDMFWAILLSFVILSYNRLITNKHHKLNNQETSNFRNVLIILIIYVLVSKTN